MNEEIKDELNEDVEKVAENPIETEDEVFFEEEADEDTPEEDVKFEYDDEGNVVIPDDYEEVEEAPEEENNEKEPEEETEKAVTPDARDAEIQRLKKEIESRDLQLRETLKSLGVDEKDAIAALEKLAAEAEDKPIEEYRKEKAERIKKEEALELIRKQKFEEKINADLAAVYAAYPEAKKYKSVYEFPNFARFGKLRDLGLSPEEAFIASHSKSVISSTVDAAQQQIRNLNNTKNHLRSNVPVGSKDKSISITKRQMKEYKDLFPDLSDKEIVALHKQTNKK